MVFPFRTNLWLLNKKDLLSYSKSEEKSSDFFCYPRLVVSINTRHVKGLKTLAYAKIAAIVFDFLGLVFLQQRRGQTSLPEISVRFRTSEKKKSEFKTSLS